MSAWHRPCDAVSHRQATRHSKRHCPANSHATDLPTLGATFFVISLVTEPWLGPFFRPRVPDDGNGVDFLSALKPHRGKRLEGRCEFANISLPGEFRVGVASLLSILAKREGDS